jgi:hypothetical protein
MNVYVQLNKAHNLSKLAITISCLFIITLSLSLFIYSGFFRGLEGLKPDAPAHDFYLWYAAGQLWNEGRDPYDHDLFRAQLTQLAGGKPFRGNTGYYYPPQTTVFFSWLAYLPVEAAYFTFIGINLICLIASIGMLALILSWYQPIGLLEITLLSSFVSTGFGRMNMREGQLGILACVLVLGLFILARYQKNRLAGVWLAALSFKPTFVPLFFGYYLLRRSYQLILVCIIVGSLITFVPLLLAGYPVVETLLNWLEMLKLQSSASSIENIDNPSPFTPNSALMSHLIPLVYRILNAQSTLTTIIAWLIIFALIGYTTYLIERHKSSHRGELLNFSLVSALSLISIYHRPYDEFLLFPGILCIYIYAVQLKDRNAKLRWGFLLVSIILLLLLPIDLSSRISSAYPILLDSYLWRIIAPFKAWVGVIVLGVLLWLKTHPSVLTEK